MKLKKFYFNFNLPLLIVKISVFMVISLVPIMVMARSETLTYFESVNWLSLARYVDLFSNSKLILLLCIVLFGMYGTIYNLRFWYFSRCYVYYLTVFLLILIIINTAFSMFTIESIWGAPSRREGLIAWICYLWLFVISYKLVIIDNKFVYWITLGFVISASIAATVGLLQSFGYDIYKSEKFLQLIHPENLHDVAKPENYPSGFSSFSTFGNSNPAGCFAAISWCFFTTLMLAMNNNFTSWLLVFFQTLLFGFLVATRSRSSWLAAFVTFFIILFITRKNLHKHYAKIIIMVFLNLFILFSLDFASLKLEGKISRLFGQFSTKKIDYKEYIPDDFKDLKLASDSITLYFSSLIMTIKIASDSFVFYNSQNQLVPYEFIGNLAKFPNNEFYGVDVKIATESKIMKITRYKANIYLKYTENGFKLLDGNGREHDLNTAEKWFIENDKWGNGRGFIWARSFPLMWRAILFGYGPDTFVHVFPNYDLLSKVKAGYGAGWLVDKPHNWYIHIGVTLGGVALAIIILFLFLFFYNACRIINYLKFSKFAEAFYASAVNAIISYCLALFFNDSYIGNAVVFWVLFGSAYSLGLRKRLLFRNIELFGKYRKNILIFE